MGRRRKKKLWGVGVEVEVEVEDSDCCAKVSSRGAVGGKEGGFEEGIDGFKRIGEIRGSGFGGSFGCGMVERWDGKVG